MLCLPNNGVWYFVICYPFREWLNLFYVKALRIIFLDIFFQFLLTTFNITLLILRSQYAVLYVIVNRYVFILLISSCKAMSRYQ